MRLSRRRTRWLKAAAIVAGGAAVGGGIVGLLATDNEAASVLLLTLGVVILLTGWIGDRVQLESFEFLGAKLRVREVVAGRLDLVAASPPGTDDDVERQLMTAAVTRATQRRRFRRDAGLRTRGFNLLSKLAELG